MHLQHLYCSGLVQSGNNLTGSPGLRLEPIHTRVAVVNP